MTSYAFLSKPFIRLEARPSIEFLREPWCLGAFVALSFFFATKTQKHKGNTKLINR